MPPSTLIYLLQIASALAAGLTALRLYRTDLHRRYPVLFVYMAWVALYGLAPLVFDTRSKLYFWIWIYCQPVQWLLDILVVRELCRMVLERHPGLVTLGRWGMYIGVIVSAFLSFLSLLPHINSAMPARSRLLAYWVAGGRGVTFGLVIFLILMMFALGRYPVHLSRNVTLNAVLFTTVFLLDSLAAILRTVFDRSVNPWLAAAVLAAEVGCLVLWFLRLNPEGEHRQFDWIHYGPEYEKRMLRRLDALSQLVGKRIPVKQ